MTEFLICQWCGFVSGEEQIESHCNQDHCPCCGFEEPEITEY